jgi:hypothetical protein
MPYFSNAFQPMFFSSFFSKRSIFARLLATATALFAENRQGGQFDSFESRRLAKTTTRRTGGGDNHNAITAPFAAQ